MIIAHTGIDVKNAFHGGLIHILTHCKNMNVFKDLNLILFFKYNFTFDLLTCFVLVDSIFFIM